MGNVLTRLLGSSLVAAMLASNCLAEDSSQTVAMRAVRMHGKGGPEVLQLDRVPIPVAGTGQVRIRILAAGVNPIDWAIRDGYTPAWLKGDPTALRIPGFDAAGVIDQIGSDVSGWKTGDAVIAALQSAPQGAYAEYAVVPAEDVAAKPASMSFDEAAGLPTVGATAWRYFIALAPPTKGQRVLIQGGAGGVGSVAVQLARSRGAHVIATASPRNHAYLRSLGAAELIDYNKVNFEEHVKDVDFVWDTVGGETLTRSLTVVRSGGVVISVAGQVDAAACVTAGVRCLSPPMPDDRGFGATLREVVQLADSGQLRLNIERVFPLEEAGAAQELNRTGHTRGKIILHIADK